MSFFDKFLFCCLGVIIGLPFGAHFQSQSLENLYESKKKIEECEAELPRNKSCEILVIAKVKEE